MKDMMTKKEMITAIVEDQVKRGVVREDNKDFQIKMRMKERQSWSYWDRVYKAIFN